MDQRIIRFCYRKIIDASSEKSWEKLIFESSYEEYKMQQQLFNIEKKYNSFAELLLHVPGAERLHFLVSSAVTSYVRQLNGTVPDITNTLGKLCLKFKEYRFEIINSTHYNKDLHMVAVNFYSESVLWHTSFVNHLLISTGEISKQDGTLTQIIELRPFLSIYSLKEIEPQQVLLEVIKN